MTSRIAFDLSYMIAVWLIAAFLVHQGWRGDRKAWPVASVFGLLSGQSLYRLLVAMGHVGQSVANTGVPLFPIVDRTLSMLFLILLVFTFVRPLFPRYRTPLRWMLGNNLIVLAGLVAVIWVDFGAHWSPGFRFSRYWGALAFEAFRVPLLVLASGTLGYVLRIVGPAPRR